MLLNLLVNANKFTKDGKISVKCEMDQLKHFVTIRVKDEGIGIRDEDKDKLFVPFENIEHG